MTHLTPDQLSHLCNSDPPPAPRSPWGPPLLAIIGAILGIAVTLAIAVYALPEVPR